jgi:2-phosphosulfolactate phosphatase
MQLDVALTPGLIAPAKASVCIVVDVLRASSACVAMFDAGAECVAIAESTDQARALRSHSLPAALLCGEVGGLPPEGFDYGNSPVEFASLDLSGSNLVLATSNGTRALHAVADAPAVLVGCLQNRAAVCAAAIDAARRFSTGIVIICAGNEYGTSFSLDDAFTAGAMIDLLGERLGSGEELSYTDAAQVSRRLFLSYDCDATGAFRDSSHGRILLGLGFIPDLEWCGRMDASASVPFLSRHPGGFLLLRTTWEG